MDRSVRTRRASSRHTSTHPPLAVQPPLAPAVSPPALAERVEPDTSKAATVEPQMDEVADELDSLVEGVVAGMNHAFHRVYDLLADRLFSFALRRLRDRGAAEDAVQQAFLELARTSSNFRGDGRSLRAWLYASVRFRCADEHRRRSRRPERPTAHLPETATTEPVDRWLSAELTAAMRSLTERQSLMLELRHVDGLSGQEIADLLNMKRPAAYAAIDRAEASLRKAFTEAMESSASAASLPLRKDDPHVTP